MDIYNGPNKFRPKDFQLGIIREKFGLIYICFCITYEGLVFDWNGCNKKKQRLATYQPL